jgi:hypothetical protein
VPLFDDCTYMRYLCEVRHPPQPPCHTSVLHELGISSVVTWLELPPFFAAHRLSIEVLLNSDIFFQHRVIG